MEPNPLEPLTRNGKRQTTLDIYGSLHSAIMSGKLKPGTTLSQAEVARWLNVSRTPVREAMRMLQEAGLLVGEPNYRSRVPMFDPEDIEALYIKRILLESLGVVLTTQQASAAVLDELEGVVKALESDDAHQSFETWLTLHRRFHQLVAANSRPALATELVRLELRSERYQSTYKGQHLPGWWQRGEAEHREIYNAVRHGQPDVAAGLMARHLARTALELLAALTPEYDAGALRACLRFAVAGAATSR